MRKIRHILEQEQDRMVLFVPVCMAAGIAWYFSLKTEPPLWLGFSLFALFALLAVWMRKRILALYICTALALVALGFGLSSFRTFSVAAPVLSEPVSVTAISGKVAEIEPTPKGCKLLLKEVSINKIPKDKTPLYISVTMREYNPDLVTGEIIHLRAGLFPPPPPAVPDGFDFGRYFYFREVGGVGFGLTPVTITPLKESGASDFEIWFAEFRHRLTESIRSYFHEPAGAVAAAFITGETRAIPDEVNDDMRIAGLYHLLAVSGMNLSVVAGLAFFTLRFLLACIPPVALRYNIKKWAAILALVVSYIYLRVSGSPVSAERAFFMVSLIFIAILLDRDPMPMRSVAIAAFCIMLYEPEAALTASFQLSFSATAALIASYEWGTGWLARKNRESGFGLRRIFFYFAAVIVTAFIAWCATEPFIIYHFNQFSSYSLIANTIAEPLVSFILMPLVMAGVLLMPLHLAWIAFTPMQYGVDLLLAIAHWTASLPHAMWIVPNPTDWGFAITVAGFIWIYFWKTGWRWFGILAVIAGLSTAFLYAPPDIFIAADGRHVAVKLDDGKMVMIRGKDSGVDAENWARAALKQGYIDKDDAPMKCDKEGCVVSIHRYKIAALRDASALSDECSLSDLVIVSFPVFPGTDCHAMLIDQRVLDKDGGGAVWLKDDGIIFRQIRPGQGNRPWVE